MSAIQKLADGIVDVAEMRVQTFTGGASRPRSRPPEARSRIGTPCSTRPRPMAK